MNEQICLFDDVSSDNIDPNSAEDSKQVYHDIIHALSVSGEKYDLSQVVLEHRKQKEEGYDAILILNKTIAHIKRKTADARSLFIVPSLKLYFASAGYDIQKAYNLWGRIYMKDYKGFSLHPEAVQEIYEKILRSSADSFGCCGRFQECSNAKKCVHQDIMFSGRCAYRQNLKNGRIFYGSNSNYPSAK